MLLATTKVPRMQSETLYFHSCAAYIRVIISKFLNEKSRCGLCTRKYGNDVRLQMNFLKSFFVAYFPFFFLRGKKSAYKEEITCMQRCTDCEDGENDVFVCEFCTWC
jgi:hypothetical protein